MADLTSYDPVGRGIKTASGHNQFPMQKILSDNFKDEFYCTTDIAQLTTNSTLEPLKR